MSELKSRISEATKTAMKARDKQRVAVLRLVNADIKRLEVDERRELSDDDVLAVLDRMLKQRNDSLNQYRQAGRQDLVDQEAYEIDLIQEFMPEPLSDEALTGLIDELIRTSGASSMQDMGRVMGALKQAAQGRVDMGKASSLVRSRLS
jgi:uncharacterized protein YqeY